MGIGDIKFTHHLEGEMEAAGPGLNPKEHRQWEKTGALTGKTGWKGTELGQLEKC